MVQSIEKNEHITSNQNQQQCSDVLEDGIQTGTIKEQMVETVSLADLCKDSTCSKGWLERSASRISRAWADYTLSNCDGALVQLQEHCRWRGYDFQQIAPPVLADYLCVIANKSDRPKYR